MGLLAALAGCAPGYYSPHPAYYPRPAYSYAPRQSAIAAQPRSATPQSGSDWVNPEPAR